MRACRVPSSRESSHRANCASKRALHSHQNMPIVRSQCPAGPIGTPGLVSRGDTFAWNKASPNPAHATTVPAIRQEAGWNRSHSHAPDMASTRSAGSANVSISSALCPNRAAIHLECPGADNSWIVEAPRGSRKLNRVTAERLTTRRACSRREPCLLVDRKYREIGRIIKRALSHSVSLMISKESHWTPGTELGG
jgi:hypothetical protein